MSKPHVPELRINDVMPVEFRAIRGARRIIEDETISVTYRRHFWYVCELVDQRDIVKFIYDNYVAALNSYHELLVEK